MRNYIRQTKATIDETDTHIIFVYIDDLPLYYSSNDIYTYKLSNRWKLVKVGNKYTMYIGVIVSYTTVKRYLFKQKTESRHDDHIWINEDLIWIKEKPIEYEFTCSGAVENAGN